MAAAVTPPATIAPTSPPISAALMPTTTLASTRLTRPHGSRCPSQAAGRRRSGRRCADNGGNLRGGGAGGGLWSRPAARRLPCLHGWRRGGVVASTRAGRLVRSGRQRSDLKRLGEPGCGRSADWPAAVDARQPSDRPGTQGWVLLRASDHQGAWAEYGAFGCRCEPRDQQVSESALRAGSFGAPYCPYQLPQLMGISARSAFGEPRWNKTPSRSVLSTYGEHRRDQVDGGGQLCHSPTVALLPVRRRGCRGGQAGLRGLPRAVLVLGVRHRQPHRSRRLGWNLGTSATPDHQVALRPSARYGFVAATTSSAPRWKPCPAEPRDPPAERLDLTHYTELTVALAVRAVTRR